MEAEKGRASDAVLPAYAGMIPRATAAEKVNAACSPRMRG